jgi:hypothetical protein
VVLMACHLVTLQQSGFTLYMYSLAQPESMACRGNAEAAGAAAEVARVCLLSMGRNATIDATWFEDVSHTSYMQNVTNNWAAYTAH